MSTTIKSLEDLIKIKELNLEKRKFESTSGNSQVIVGMGTCSIAAGARNTMQAILNEIESGNLRGITVKQTGCIGMCEREPIVHVIVGGGRKVTYGKVNPQIASRILREHILGGQIVKDYVIEA